MNVLKIVRNPYTSLIVNVVYAIGNCMIGFLTHSWWFITVGSYYVVLTVTRYSVLRISRKAEGDYDIERFVRRMTGILLVVLSLCIVGVNILSAVKDRGTIVYRIPVPPTLVAWARQRALSLSIS